MGSAIPPQIYVQSGEVLTPITQAPLLLNAAPGNVTQDMQLNNSRYGTSNALPTDQPKHPHLIDVYEPAGTIGFVVLAFHGGGGNRRQYAASLGILIGANPSASSTNWGPLTRNNCAMWFVQGQYCGAPGQPAVSQFNPRGVVTPKTTAWDNYAFYSGVDDKQMANDAYAAIRAKYGANICIITLGHSSGGMFTQRLWSEHQAGWSNVYFCTSGPRPTYYRTNPELPTIVKPMCNFYGLLDTVLNIYPGHWLASDWIQGVDHYSPADVVTPIHWIGEPYEGYQTRINAYNTFHGNPAEVFDPNSGYTVKNIAQGTQTTWSFCGGAMVMELLSNSDHEVKTMQACKGYHLLTDVIAFAVTALGLGA